ncbi:hypothetical protein GCM10027299_20780 [Larkinella ripae]
MYDLGAYPGAVFDPTAQNRVHGEVYRLEESGAERLLQTLDAYEGGEYVRRVVPVQTAYGLLACWTYLFHQPTHALPLIASGRFFD